jgi:hypothetical protein
MFCSITSRSGHLLKVCCFLPLLTPACSDSDPRGGGSPENGASLTEDAVPSSDPGEPRMIELLQNYALRSETDLPILGDLDSRTFRQRLAQLDPQPSTLEGEVRLLQMTMNLSKSEMRQGKLDESIRLAESSYRRLQEFQKSNPLPSRLLAMVAYDLGVAHMRRAESRNCCARNAPENCILPIRGGGIHGFPEDSKQAIRYFTEVLTKAPPATSYYLKSKWLLNVMYMAIGGYPEQVPEQYRIPPAEFESEVDFPRFKNIAFQVGVDAFDLLGGVIIDDFTGDGYLDIVVSTWDPKESMRFFRNMQDGSFSDVTDDANLTGAVGGFNIIQADYDNDGDLDILVLRGAWLGEQGKVPNSLLQNDGSGKFSDVTFAAGLAEVHYPTQTASWADYDNDGHLDLYVGNEHRTDVTNAPCQLFHNNGDGTFSDLAKVAGVQNMRFAKSVVWGDYNADGFADLYVSNFGGSNRLYRNKGDGTFLDEASELNVAGPDASFVAWFWDFDNDGVLDIFVSGYDYSNGKLTAYVESKLGIPGEHVLPRLYRGDGKGGFSDVAQRQNLDEASLPMGANFGDLDNDGFLDFYLGTGYPAFDALMPSVMYRNRGGHGFSDITFAGGFGHLQKGHGVAFADIDNDGDQDIYEQMGGFFRSDKAFNSLFENPGFENRWIAVTLVGVKSNRSAIGARIQVQIVEDGRLRTIYRHVNSGGSFGANPLRQTIGLGKASNIEQLVVEWPGTGLRQTFRDLALDQFVEITEGLETFHSIPLKELDLSSTGQ